MEDGGNGRTNKGVLLQLTWRTFSNDCFLRSLLAQALLLVEIQGKAGRLLFRPGFGVEKRGNSSELPLTGEALKHLVNRSLITGRVS